MTMMWMVTTGTKAIGVAMLGGLLSTGAASQHAQTAPVAKAGQTPAVGQKAPDFALKTLDGDIRDRQDRHRYVRPDQPRAR